MSNNLLEELKRSLRMLEIEFMVIPNKNIIRMLGDNYGLIQISEDATSYRIIKILEKNDIDKTVLNNLDCINFDLEAGKYYLFDNELWFEINVYVDENLTLSAINDSISAFCNTPDLLKAV
ncbi:MAG: hypothetical protein MJ245_05925 [Clostridia bacterium]|nr:hypothetical protein [Clostridia bacterium]